MSRVTQQIGTIGNQDAVRITTSPAECWFEVSDAKFFTAWMNDTTDTGAGYTMGEANRAWLHDQLDAWIVKAMQK